MKLKEFMNNLTELVKNNPEAENYDVVTSKDEEGNGFEKVHYSASDGVFEDGEFIPREQLSEYDRDESEINSVCVN